MHHLASTAGKGLKMFAITPQILAHKLAAHLLCTCDMEVTGPNLCVMLTFYYETMQFLLCSPLSQFISGHNS